MNPHNGNFDPPPEAAEFYAESLVELVASGVPFMLSGTYALGCHTGIMRPTKDLDVFCKAGDAPRILAHFKHLGHEVEFEDERWIGKVWKGKWRGQRQRWFLFRFLGEDGDIDIATEHPEFRAWKWVAPETLPDLIVPFKRKLYRDILHEFHDLI